MIYELIDIDKDLNSTPTGNSFVKSNISKKDFKKTIKKLRKKYKKEIEERDFNSYNLQTIEDSLQPDGIVLDVEQVYDKKVIKLKW